MVQLIKRGMQQINMGFPGRHLFKRKIEFFQLERSVTSKPVAGRDFWSIHVTLFKMEVETESDFNKHSVYRIQNENGLFTCYCCLIADTLHWTHKIIFLTLEFSFWNTWSFSCLMLSGWRVLYVLQ